MSAADRDGADRVGAAERLADGAVLLSAEPGMLRVQLHRPEKRNALNGAMISALHEVLDRIEAEPVRVLLLTGVPGAFCAGADIAGYLDAADDPEALARFTEEAKRLCTRLSRSRAVVLAAVDGLAMGGGLELLLAADLAIASETSRFALPEIRLGLIPGWGGTQRLTRDLGAKRAALAIMTGQILDAATAHDTGLISRVVPADSLESEAEALAAALVASAPDALAAAKRAIRAALEGADGEHGTESYGAALETELLLELFASPDGREGVAAFAQKRSPVFTPPRPIP